MPGRFTGSRDLIYVTDPHSGKRVIDLDASYRGFPQSGGRTLMDLTCAIAARVGVPNTYDTTEPR